MRRSDRLARLLDRLDARTGSRVGRRAAALIAGFTATAVLAPAGASAAVQTISIDGPSAALVNSEDIRVDSAPDGTAAVAYRKSVGGQDHVFVSIRQADGAWSAPEQVDAGVPGAPQPSSLPTLGVANGGRVVVVFANGVAGFEKLHAAIKPTAAAPFGPILTVQGDPAGWKDPRLDLAPNGNGFLTVQEAKHVRACQLVGSTFAPG
ncbi:MAG: hypothetical protein Q7T55_04685, partial [Solirubrobacteraceae bacterium]|nr:hypothetical protein [Solirubrobacteraceae bacterium]